MHANVPVNSRASWLAVIKCVIPIENVLMAHSAIITRPVVLADSLKYLQTNSQDKKKLKSPINIRTTVKSITIRIPL